MGDDPSVMFPEIIMGFEATSDVLIETFCEGMPFGKFVEQYQHDSDKLAKMCCVGIRTFCRMTFDHNFIHADLHPGNILVCPKEDKFTFLDAGMVTEYTEEDHDVIVKILTSFIRCEGDKAAELMLSDSNRRMLKKSYESSSNVDSGSDNIAVNENAYIKKIARMVDMAHTCDDFFKNLSQYIAFICDAAATHRVMMNQTFVSFGLAVKVQEGVAMSLDPSIKVWNVANPIILRYESQRYIDRLKDNFRERVMNF